MQLDSDCMRDGLVLTPRGTLSANNAEARFTEPIAKIGTKFIKQFSLPVGRQVSKLFLSLLGITQ